MTNPPKTVQWVLDFLNINNTPGKPDPDRSLKRPPRPEITSSLKLADNEHTIIDENTGYRWRIKDNKPQERIDSVVLLAHLRELEQRKMELLRSLTKGQKQTRQPKKKKIKPIEELSGLEVIEELQKFQSEKGEDAIPNQNIREIIKNPDKDIEFVGIIHAPTLEDYKQFFMEKGIPPLPGKELLLENRESLSTLDVEAFRNRPKNNNDQGFYNYYQDNPPIEHRFFSAVDDVRFGLALFFNNLVDGTATYKSLVLHISHIKDLWRKSLFKDKPVIPGVLYACIANSVIDGQEIYSRLRRCPCCGSFWILDNMKKRGRPQVHCGNKCKGIFNYPSRPKGNETQQKHRDSLKDIKIKNAHFEIEEYLVERGYSRKEATEIYNNLSKSQRSSFKEFYRTNGQHWGL